MKKSAMYVHQAHVVLLSAVSGCRQNIEVIHADGR